MGLFGKKKKDKDEEEEPEPEEPAEEEKEPAPSGNASLGQVQAEVDKLSAKFSSFYELQKSYTERFTRVNEQIGELRSMMIQRDKDSQLLEAKATQAIDLVATVQPDKLMIEMQKEDGKIEALRGNLESNETIMHNIVNELKEMRNKMNTFRGIEQTIQLNEEVKKELMDIRRLKALIERHADKVETIFSEVKKRFSEFERMGDVTKDLDNSFKDMTADVDSLKVRTSDLANKKEVEDLIAKVNDFEDHASHVLGLLDERFDRLQKDFNERYEKKTSAFDRLLKGFQVLAEKTPDLDKYFHLLEEEAKKAPKEANVEKIKTDEEKAPEKKEEPEEKKGFFKSIFKKKEKEEKKPQKK
jgi:hypothetical protein